MMKEKELIKLAYQLAEKGHAGQTRHDRVTPYMAHVHDVANQVRRVPGTTSTHLIVAILHDVVEDTHYTLEYLREAGFPQDVLDAVDAITHPKEEPYGEYIDRVLQNPVATLVKYVDIRSNLSDSPSKKSRENYNKYLPRFYT